MNQHKSTRIAYESILWKIAYFGGFNPSPIDEVSAREYLLHQEQESEAAWARKKEIRDKNYAKDSARERIRIKPRFLGGSKIRQLEKKLSKHHVGTNDYLEISKLDELKPRRSSY